MFKVWPYRQGSASAKALSVGLGGRVLFREGSRFRPNNRAQVINWGDPDPPDFVNWNRQGIRAVSNKLHFFREMSAQTQDLLPLFWTNNDDIPDDAFPIVCRTVLAGHSGEGIVIANGRADLVPAPLYVQYVKKQDEYRVHVGRRQRNLPVVIGIQKKSRRLDTPDADVNWQIRNHSNGFVYVRNGFTPPELVVEKALTALSYTALDFGAVDVIWNERQQRAYVLEVNTAPGITGQTVNDYVTFFTGQ